MGLRGKLALLLLAALSQASKCTEPPPAPPFQVRVRVESEPNVPVGETGIFLNGILVGKTNAKGIADLTLNGNEGESAELTVRCPADYQSPTKPIVAPLRRLAESAKIAEFSAVCARMQKTVVIAVRAENGPNLAVVYLGKEVARTDARGAAHVLLHLRAGEPFELLLDTSNPAHGQLRPQNPVSSFTTPTRDELVLLDQKFVVEKSRPVFRRALPPHRPTRI